MQFRVSPRVRRILAAVYVLLAAGWLIQAASRPSPARWVMAGLFAVVAVLYAGGVIVAERRARR
jgi:heme A synthase